MGQRKPTGSHVPHATLAQMEEHSPCKRERIGSTPIGGSVVKLMPTRLMARRHTLDVAIEVRILGGQYESSGKGTSLLRHRQGPESSDLNQVKATSNETLTVVRVG